MATKVERKQPSAVLLTGAHKRDRIKVLASKCAGRSEKRCENFHNDGQMTHSWPEEQGFSSHE